jgi:hypothetical protein
VELVNAPIQLVEPFAVNAAPSGGFGGKNTVPVPSQIAITPGAASFNDGFVPLNMTPIDEGGIVMSGLDLNGVFFQTSAPTQWMNCGGGFKFNSALVTAIGGYPMGARVLNATGTGYWISTADNNTANPDEVAAGQPTWIPDFNVAISVFASAQQTVATGTNKVLFDTVEFDTYGLYNIANQQFQISWAGKYRLSGCIFLPAPAGQDLSTFVFRNGNLAKICFAYPQVTDQAIAMPFDAITNCAVADFLDVRIQPSQASVLVGNVGSNQTTVYAQLEYLGA